MFLTQRVPLLKPRDLGNWRNYPKAVPRTLMAPFMFLGVQIGGMGIIPAPFRWGFGWKWPRTGP